LPDLNPTTFLASVAGVVYLLAAKTYITPWVHRRLLARGFKFKLALPFELVLVILCLFFWNFDGFMGIFNIFKGFFVYFLCFFRFFLIIMFFCIFFVFFKVFLEIDSGVYKNYLF
jgi:hypothetical protein